MLIRIIEHYLLLSFYTSTNMDMTIGWHILLYLLLVQYQCNFYQSIWAQISVFAECGPYLAPFEGSIKHPIKFIPSIDILHPIKRNINLV